VLEATRALGPAEEGSGVTIVTANRADFPTIQRGYRPPSMTLGMTAGTRQDPDHLLRAWLSSKRPVDPLRVQRGGSDPLTRFEEGWNWLMRSRSAQQGAIIFPNIPEALKEALEPRVAAMKERVHATATCSAVPAMGRGRRREPLPLLFEVDPTEEDDMSFQEDDE
jgi:hypothetical protein